MTVDRKITWRFPSTGASPAEQTAEHARENNGEVSLSRMTESDKLIFQLVANNVSYAGEQLSDNLRFSSETLTNVLYDNIYSLLEEKFDEDEFVKWVADGLVENGAVWKVEENPPPPSEDTVPDSEPKVEKTVYELDDSQYRELISRVDAAVQLLKANRINLFKLFSEAQEQIRDFSDEKKTGVVRDEKNLMRLRDEQIDSLVRKIQGNQKTLEDYVQTQEDNREEIQEQFVLIQDRMDTYMGDREKSISGNRRVLNSIRKSIERLAKTSSSLEKKSREALKKEKENNKPQTSLGKGKQGQKKNKKKTTSEKKPQPSKVGTGVGKVVGKPQDVVQTKKFPVKQPSEVLQRNEFLSDTKVGSPYRKKPVVSIKQFSRIFDNPRVLGEKTVQKQKGWNPVISTRFPSQVKNAIKPRFGNVIPKQKRSVKHNAVKWRKPSAINNLPVILRNRKEKRAFSDKPIMAASWKPMGKAKSMVSSMVHVPPSSIGAGTGIKKQISSGKSGIPGFKGYLIPMKHGMHVVRKTEPHASHIGIPMWNDKRPVPSYGKKDSKPTQWSSSRGPSVIVVNTVPVKGKNKVKNAISSSPVGKMVRAMTRLVSVITKVVKVVSKVIKTVVKVAVKTAKVVWKTAKFASKAFVSASSFVGRGVKATAVGIGRGMQRFTNSVKDKGIVRAVLDLNGAVFVSRLGWRAIKWVGRKIWGWIKKVAQNIAGGFNRLFSFYGKFQNKAKIYLRIILNGLKDKTYRFIGKPIAGILQAVFAFTVNVVMAPVKFMQWAIPSILERFRNVMSDIRSASYDLMKSTQSIFKRIMFNPITIALLVGGMFYFFWPKLVEWVKGGLFSLGRNIIGTVMNWVSSVWSFAKKVWNAVVPIAEAVYKFTMWLTDPNGWMVRIAGQIISTIFWIKNIIKKVMGFAGYDSLDFTCMWLSGDFIGLALAMVEGLCIKAWHWASNLPFFRKIIAMIKALVKAKKMIADLPGVIWDSISGATWDILTGKWGEISEDFSRPWRDWWNSLKQAMDNNSTFDEKYERHRISVLESASESSKKTKQNVAISTRSLKMKGMYSEGNLKYMDSISRVTNSITNKSVLSRIEHMTKLYMHNVEGLENYQKFISSVWEEGSSSDESAAYMLKALLENPVLSQRLMTPFFYYNPQTSQVMSMRPSYYIGQFVQNIRNLVGTNENRDNISVLKTLVMAFDQMNEEKWITVEAQGKIINDFVQKVYNLNVNDKEHGDADQIVLRNLTRQLNKGDLFSSIRIQQSFEQFQKNETATRDLTSKATGEKFGSSNPLLHVKMKGPPSQNRRNQIADTRKEDYIVKMPENRTNGNMTHANKSPSNQGMTQIGNINLGPDLSPFDSQDVVDRQKLSRQQMYQKFLAYDKKRQEKVAEYDSVDKAAQAGYENIGFEEFARRYENTIKPSEQREREESISEQDKGRKLAGMRIVKSIQEWQNQGSDISDEERNMMSINGAAANTIWNLNTDGIEQDLYMFSPQWKQISGNLKITDKALLAKIAEGGASMKKFLGIDFGGANDSGEEWGGESVGHEETEDERLDREEREQRELEKRALDFSARVKNGYIEVKIQEDQAELERLWYQNQGMYNDMRVHMSAEEVNKRGVYSFPVFEDFVRYWRKKNGHPLDGIRRYKFNAKPIEHKVDFSVRNALSTEEMQRHGIQISETGPVMVPADKAMEIAKSLFAQARSVYSIRDGLEVMKMGVDDELTTIRKRNKKGPTIVSTLIPSPDVTNSVQIQDQTNAL